MIFENLVRDASEWRFVVPERDAENSVGCNPTIKTPLDSLPEGEQRHRTDRSSPSGTQDRMGSKPRVPLRFTLGYFLCRFQRQERIPLWEISGTHSQCGKVQKRKSEKVLGRILFHIFTLPLFPSQISGTRIRHRYILRVLCASVVKKNPGTR